jgi:uncharacterized integral membrane protein
MASEPAQPAKHPASRRDQARLWASVAGGVLVALFALLNLDKVKVDLIFGSPRWPLIVVIVGCLALGAAIDRLWIRHAARRRKR